MTCTLVTSPRFLSNKRTSRDGDDSQVFHARKNTKHFVAIEGLLLEAFTT
jgi:hypothetical protein